MERHGLQVDQLVDAKKIRRPAETALEWAMSHSELIVIKGRSYVRFTEAQMKSTPEQVLTAILGPSGNLRAPAASRDGRGVVGYSEDVWTAEFTRA